MAEQTPGNPGREGEAVSWVIWEARAHVGTAAAALALISVGVLRRVVPLKQRCSMKWEMPASSSRS